jgi:hypothetical protein
MVFVQWDSHFAGQLQLNPQDQIRKLLQYVMRLDRYIALQGVITTVHINSLETVLKLEKNKVNEYQW